MDITGYSIFCDDIRHEVQGTVSYIGVYGPQMNIAATFPIVLPKFAIATFVRLSPETEADYGFDELVVKAFFPGENEDSPRYTMQLNGENVRNELVRMKSLSPPEDSDQGLQFVLPMIFAPVPLLAPGLIRIRGFAEGNRIRLGALRVAGIATQEAITS